MIHFNLKRYLSLIALTLIVTVSLRASANDLEEGGGNEALDATNIDVAQVQSEDMIKMSVGEERTLNSGEEGDEWRVLDIAVGSGKTIASGNLPVGFYSLEVSKGSSISKKLSMLVAPPPPGMMTGTGLLTVTDLVAVEEEEIRVGEFQITGIEFDTLNQIALGFINAPDLELLGDAGQYLITDLDIANPDITDNLIEYRGVVVEVTNEGTVATLALGGINDQPGEEYQIDILGLTGVVIQPDFSPEPEIEIVETMVSTETGTELLSSIDTLNQITLINSDLEMIGTGTDLTATGAYSITDIDEANTEVTDKIEIRGVLTSTGEIVLSIAGMTEQTGEKYLVTIGSGTGSEVVEIELAQEEFPDLSLEIKIEEAGDNETGTGNEVIEKESGTGEDAMGDKSGDDEEAAGSGETVLEPENTEEESGTGTEATIEEQKTGSGERAINDEESGTGEVVIGDEDEEQADPEPVELVPATELEIEIESVIEVESTPELGPESEPTPEPITESTPEPESEPVIEPETTNNDPAQDE